MTRTQLLGLGVGRGAITSCLESGRFVAVHQGVYCIGPRRDDPVSRAAAAVLACGPGAVLSHESAASLWGFLPRWSFPLEVTARGERERPGIATHRCRSFQPRDVTRQCGVLTTSRARMLLDLAPSLAAKQLTRLVNDARPRFTPAPSSCAFINDPANPTASHLEDLFLAFIKKYNLPTPVINFNLRRKQPDAYFPQHNLIVPTIWITEQRLTTDPDREAARLKEILDQLAPG